MPRLPPYPRYLQDDADATTSFSFFFSGATTGMLSSVATILSYPRGGR